MNHSSTLPVGIIDSIGILSIGYPPANQLDKPEFIPLCQFREWIQDESMKALIIKGEGRNFSSGGNIQEIFDKTRDPEQLNQMMFSGKELLETICDLSIPVIAAINRVCFGGGLEIALSCHIRVASENALLAFPEVNSNLMPGLGGTIRLPNLVGVAESIRMILGGDIVNAANALQIGLIDYLAPRDQAFEFALTLTRKITNDRPVEVIHAIMKSLKNATILSPSEAMKEETSLFCKLAVKEAERRKTKGE